MAAESAELEFLVRLKDEATAALQGLQGVLKDVTGPLPDVTAGVDIDAGGAVSGAEEAATAADDIPPGFADAGEEAGAGLTDGIEGAVGDLDIDPAVEEALNGVPDTFAQEGETGGEEFADGVSSEVEDGGARWGVIAAAAAAAMVAAVVGAAVGLYKVGAIFDDVGDTIATQTGASGARLEELQATVDDIASTTPADFETITAAVAGLAQRTDLTGKPLEDLARQVVNLGNVGQQVDLNTLTGALSVFGVQGKDAGGVLDDLFRISQSTGVGVNELASSVSSGAAALKPFGLGITDSAALLGTLDKAGIDSGSTVSALQRGLGNFAAAGKDPRTALQGVIDEIGKFVAAGDTAGAVNVAAKIFGTRGAAQFVNAVASGKVNLDGLMASAGATGAGIDEMAASTADGAESFQVLKNKALLALKPLGVEVFGVAGQVGALAVDALPQLIAAVQQAGAMVSSVSAFYDAHSTAINGVAIVVGVLALGYAGLAIASGISSGALLTWAASTSIVTGVTSALTAAQGALNLVMAANPFVLLAIALVAVVAGLVYFLTQTETGQKIVEAVWGGIKTAISAVTDWITGTAVPAVVTAWQWIVDKATAMYDGVKGIFGAVVGFFQQWWPLLLAIFLPALFLLLAAWNKWGDDIIKGAKAAWAFVRDSIITPVGEFVSWVMSKLGEFGGWLSAKWTEYVATVRAVWGLVKAAVVDPVVDFIATVATKMAEFVTSVVAPFTEAKRQVDAKIVAFVQVGADLIAGIIQGVKDKAKELASSVADAARSALEAAKSALGIHSPSRVFRDEVGAMMGAGWAGGLDDAGAEVIAAAEAIARDAAAAANEDLSVGAAAASARPVTVNGSSSATSTMTIRHEVVSPDGSVSAMTAGDVADLLGRDPRAAAAVERALRPQRTFTASNLLTTS